MVRRHARFAFGKLTWDAHEDPPVQTETDTLLSAHDQQEIKALRSRIVKLEKAEQRLLEDMAVLELL